MQCTLYRPNMYKASTFYIQIVYEVYTCGVPTIYQICPIYLHSLYQMCTKHIHVVYWKYTCYIPAIYQIWVTFIVFGCTCDIPTLYTKYIQKDVQKIYKTST